VIDFGKLKYCDKMYNEPTAIYIDNCYECRTCIVKNVGVGTKPMYNWYCSHVNVRKKNDTGSRCTDPKYQLPQLIVHDFDFTEKPPPVPSWCPKRRKHVLEEE
jgi:hypothetical protein